MEFEHDESLLPDANLGSNLQKWRDELFDLLCSRETVRYLSKELAIIVINYVFRRELGKLTTHSKSWEKKDGSSL